ncbi:hypothetical protein HK102_007669, partial [Quaeritorhiza haematococci]
MNPVSNLKHFPVLRSQVQTLKPRQFLLPGFVDTHIHAPQYVYTGTGYDLPLMQWLEKYTFPRESAFSSPTYARKSYTQSVKRSLRCGTTTACYYATIHLPACKILTEVIRQCGQRAFIGKVNMDRNSPDFYIEERESSVKETREFVDFVLGLGDERVTPIITPRFVPTCSAELMQALGDIAREKNLPIQSHLCENPSEIEFVKTLHPECSSYTDVYRTYGLLTDRSVMAHCVYLTDEEVAMIKDYDAGIAHCPNSNFSLQSG